MLTSVTVRGPFRGPTGYDHHTREFVRELLAQGVAVELQDLAMWSPAKLAVNLRDPLFEALSRPCESRTVLHFCMPHQVVPDPEKVNANFTAFEADRVHPDWVKANRNHDVVIVPTQSSKSAWVKSGLPEHRIRICPFGVNSTAFSGAAEPLEFGDPEPNRYRVRFLNVSEINARKNLAGLLEAWMLATSRVDDAVLVLKLGFYEHDARERFEKLIEHLETRLYKRLSEAAPLFVTSRLLSDADMPRLYAAATHYISMSHGEGWDQPMMEAAASGLRLIAPAHSAYLAYLDSSVASLIRSEEVPVVFEGNAATAELFKGASWWQPDLEEAIQYIRAAIQGHDQCGAFPRDRILNQFTWEHATRRLIGILDEVETLKEKVRPFLTRINQEPRSAS
jgi:glycosyltransferase involved in cell wall biosynthesis